MKTIKNLLSQIMLLAAAVLLTTNIEAQTEPIEEPKFDVTIIKAGDAEKDKFGVSITNFQEKFQYTFEWEVDGKPASNSPYLKHTNGKSIKLTVTRYPGGDQSVSTFDLNSLECDLPLYPKTLPHKGELATL